MSKAFASTGDTGPKRISFGEIGPSCHAFTTEGDPNSGVIIGDDSVIVIDAQATPAMAQQVIERIRQVTDKPIRYVVLSHYHAVRVLGAVPGLALVPLEGSEHCCGSAGIYNLIEPDVSATVLAPKLANIADTHASIVATGNPGCLMQIGGRLSRKGSTIRAMHLAELLASK